MLRQSFLGCPSKAGIPSMIIRIVQVYVAVAAVWFWVSNEILFSLVGQKAAILQEVKVKSLKKNLVFRFDPYILVCLCRFTDIFFRPATLTACIFAALCSIKMYNNSFGNLDQGPFWLRFDNSVTALLRILCWLMVALSM